MPNQNNNVVKDARRLFTVMNLVAWTCLVTGIILCAWNLNHLSDNNLYLMLGIGFLVGSVFIYTIGTAINMVENRKSEHRDL